MNKYRIGILLLSFLIITNSCSPVSPINTVQSSSNNWTEVYPVNTPTLINIIITPAKTQYPRISPSITNTPERTSTLETETPTIKNESIVDMCLEIKPHLPTDANVNGVIITRNYGISGKADTNLINFDNNTNQRLPVMNGFISIDYATSPDGKWLAYKNSNDTAENSRLIIANAQGIIIQDIPWQNEWYTIQGWLDNEHLLISNQNTETKFGSLNELNPFTKDKNILTTGFPEEVLPGEVYLNWAESSSSGAVYNPSLTQVVYPRTEKDVREIMLWDMINNQEISSIPTVLALSPEPKWSPDGKRIAIVQYAVSGAEKSNIVLIDNQGNIEQLIDTKNFDQNYIGSLNWSPNGRYIAFWLNAMPSNYPGDRLVIIDTISHTMTNYCIPGSVNGDSIPPIWSPDSNKLIIENYQGDNTRDVILVDIVNKYAAKIAEGETPIGWMVSP